MDTFKTSHYVWQRIYAFKGSAYLKCAKIVSPIPIFLLILKQTMDIVTAECGCPAGKGPATCEHVGAPAEFSRYGRMPDFLTCTEKLQSWNQPCPKKLDVIPVADLSLRKDKILRREKKRSLIQGSRSFKYS